MKNPKKPTYSQRKLLNTFGLDPHDWFVVKDCPDEMVIVHRHTNASRTIQKGWVKP